MLFGFNTLPWSRNIIALYSMEFRSTPLSFSSLVFMHMFTRDRGQFYWGEPPAAVDRKWPINVWHLYYYTTNYSPKKIADARVSAAKLAFHMLSLPRHPIGPYLIKSVNRYGRIIVRFKSICVLHRTMFGRLWRPSKLNLFSGSWMTCRHHSLHTNGASTYVARVLVYQQPT